MKFVSKEEQEALSDEIYRGAIVGAVWGFAISVPASIILARKVPFFRRLGLPLRGFLVTVATAGGSAYNAEESSNRFRARLYRQVPQAPGIQELEEQPFSLKKWAKQNEVALVGTGWLSALVIGFIVASRNKYQTWDQKLVQARMYAQMITVAMLLVGAFTASKSSSSAQTNAWKFRKRSPEDQKSENKA